MSVRGDIEKILRVELFACRRAIANRNLMEATERLTVAIHELERIRPQIDRMEQAARSSRRLFRDRA